MSAIGRARVSSGGLDNIRNNCQEIENSNKKPLSISWLSLTEAAFSGLLAAFSFLFFSFLFSHFEEAES